MANKGRLYNLWNLFGWYDAAPNNFTKEERRRGGSGDLKWGSDNISQYYYSTINPSSDWSSRQTELDEMVRYELIRPIIELYAEECLSGDTLIPMLDGTMKTIRELHNSETRNGWVYGLTEDGVTVPACFERVKLVRKNAEVIKISWVDNFGKKGSVKVTPDHKMMCLGGKYVPAGELVVGDKLHGLIRNNFKARGRSQYYESVFTQKSRKWQTTHRMVAASIYGEIPEGHVVHHKDYNSLNNSPDNLEVMSGDDHRKLHDNIGSKNPNYRNDITWEIFYREATKESPSTLEDVLSNLKCNVKVVNRLLLEAGFSSWTDFAKRTFGKNPKEIASSDIRIKKNLSKQEKALLKLVKFGRDHPEAPLTQYRNEFRGEFDVENTIQYFGFSRWNDFKKHYGLNVIRDVWMKTVNHTITSIEKCDPEDVFDLVNSNPTHNFAAGSGESFIYVSNCCQPDLNKRKTVWYTCSDSNIEKELNQMLDRINIEDHIFSIAFSIAGTGNSFRRILRNENGISQIVAVDNREITRIWEPSTRRLLGYKWQGNSPYTPDDAISYLGDTELFSPWEFIHFRRIADNNSEYGTGLIEHLFGTYRKIKMAMDAMVVYRLHTMPTRHMLWLDCGNQTIFEMAQQANQLRNLLRNQVSIDTVNQTMEQRYNPPATDSILFFPFRKGEEHKLEKMEGTREVPDVHDLDLLFKQLFGGARIPKGYLGFEDQSSGLSKASLVAQDIRFARMIRVLRLPIIVGMKRLAELHLAFKGYDPKEVKIEVEMSKISSIEEEVNAATMSQQVALASNLAQLCQGLKIPNKEIIDLIFKEYLHVPREFVEIAKLAAAIEKAVADNRESLEQSELGPEGGVGGGMGGGMGGGIDDIGSELGLGGSGGTDIGAAPEAPEGGAMPPPEGMEVASTPKAANLFENRYIREFLQGLKSSKVLTESKDAGKTHVIPVRSSLRRLMEIQRQKKTSLIENCDVSTLETESYFDYRNREKEDFRKTLRESYDSHIANPPKTGEKKQHPAVALVNHMRRKSRNG